MRRKARVCHHIVTGVVHSATILTSYKGQKRVESYIVPYQVYNIAYFVALLGDTVRNQD